MEKQSKKICVMTSVHTVGDTRIYLKEIKSLLSAGYHVVFVNKEKEGTEGNLQYIKVNIPASRLKRMLFSSKIIYRVAKEQHADVYHFHDPELLPVGKRLAKTSKVIYDVHEDVPRQILTKPYLKKNIAKIVSHFFEKYENNCVRHMDAVITATSVIRDRFQKVAGGKPVVDINNFPILDEFSNMDTAWANKKKQVCYVGGITKIRGIEEMISALEYTDTTLALGGNFENKELKESAESQKGYSRVRDLGFLNRHQVAELFKESCAGLVLLHPTVNYLVSLPIKMFEYMAGGIPVIASDFPYWRNIMEGCHAGICVNPLDPKAIAEAIDYMISHPEEAEQMGKNGKKAVLEKYNWSVEEKKLLALYQQLLP